jgi:hypothetical protein
MAVQDLIVLLAVENPLIREYLARLISSEMDLHATIEYCDPAEVLIAARRTNARAVFIDRDDNALPGPCTNLLDQFPNIGVFVISPKQTCPPLYYRQATCVEELEASGAAILTALRYLQG